MEAQRTCARCSAHLERMDGVEEIFVKREIMAGNKGHYQPHSGTGIKEIDERINRRRNVAESHVIDDGKQQHSARRLSYQWFCPACNAVYPEEMTKYAPARPILAPFETEEERQEFHKTMMRITRDRMEGRMDRYQHILELATMHQRYPVLGFDQSVAEIIGHFQERGEWNPPENTNMAEAEEMATKCLRR